MPTSSNDVTYLAPYTGSVSRILTGKLADVVSPEDFGAAADGTTDDTAAVQAALDSGRNVLLTGHYRVTATLDVRKRGQRIFGQNGPGTGTVDRVNISVATDSSVTPVINVRNQGVTIQNVVINGPGSAIAGSALIHGEQTVTEAGTEPGVNRGDVDLKVVECALINAYTMIRIIGRGLNVQGCNLAFFTHAIDMGWPPEGVFVPGGNSDQTLRSGIRAYTIRDNRFHGGRGGYLVRNIHADAQYMHGLLFIGNYADTNCRMFQGKANETVFSGNTIIHSFALGPVFDISGGDNIRIAGNMIYGMTDNGAGVSYEIQSGLVLTDVTNVSIDGNHFKRVNQDLLTVGGLCRNIAFRGNMLKDVCLDNGDTEEGGPYHVVRVVSPISGLSVVDNVVDNVEMAVNPPMIGLTATASIADLVVRDNHLPPFMTVHDLLMTAS